MNPSSRFTHTDIAKPKTHSSRAFKACWLEDVASGAAVSENVGSENTDCPYQEACQFIGHIPALQKAFGSKISVTLTEATSNIVLRSENQFHGDQQHRMSLRKHLYELVSDAATERRYSPLTRAQASGFVKKLKYDRDLHSFANSVEEQIESRLDKPYCFGDPKELTLTELADGAARMLIHVSADDGTLKELVSKVLDHVDSPINCNRPDATGYAKYLGFADIRTNSPKSPIAMALLVPPRDLRHDRNVFLSVGLYGPLFGAEGFPCTPYSMHDPETGGAYCAQSCLIMALTALADRDATILGSFDLTVAAQAKPATTERILPVRGLDFNEMEKVINVEGNASAYATSFDMGPLRQKQFCRLVDAYVSARCPVIVGVHSDRWNHRPLDKGEPHTVVVTGVRRGGGGAPINEVSELVVHDPSGYPYMVRPIEECSRAALDLPGAQVPVLFTGSKMIQFHAVECLDYLEQNHVEEFNRFILPICEEDWADPVFRELLEEKPGIEPGNDYDIQLIHSDDILRAYGRPQCSSEATRRRLAGMHSASTGWEHASKLKQETESLPPGWFWAVTLFRQGSMSALWLFSAETSPESESPQDPIRVDFQ